MYFKNSQTQSETVKFGLRSAKFCRKEKGLFFSRLIEKPTKLGPLTGAAFTNAALGLSAVRPAGPASAGRSRLCRARKGEHRNWFIDEFVILFYPLGINTNLQIKTKLQFQGVTISTCVKCILTDVTTFTNGK